jgi:outer membrane protein OmpA-like peptidoglycan-associated protein
MMNLKKVFPVLLIISILITNYSCNSSRALKGGAIGAAAGGAAGAIIGYQSGHTAEGAIIGAAIGGTGGALIGHYMDKQAKELQNDMKGARVERVGEGIKITFDSGILFDVNSSELRSTSKDNIKELARVLNKYGDTNILIEGHTDNSGTDQYNQTLSEQRAGSVSNYLKIQNVLGNRISTVGYGESQPVADNSTAMGRQENRRVEIAIYANNKLKRAAKRGII